MEDKDKIYSGCIALLFLAVALLFASQGTLNMNKENLEDKINEVAKTAVQSKADIAYLGNTISDNNAIILRELFNQSGWKCNSWQFSSDVYGLGNTTMENGQILGMVHNCYEHKHNENYLQCQEFEQTTETYAFVFKSTDNITLRLSANRIDDCQEWVRIRVK